MFRIGSHRWLAEQLLGCLLHERSLLYCRSPHNYNCQYHCDSPCVIHGNVQAQIIANIIPSQSSYTCSRTIRVQVIKNPILAHNLHYKQLLLNTQASNHWVHEASGECTPTSPSTSILRPYIHSHKSAA